MKSANNMSLKVVFIGDSYVGKTSIIARKLNGSLDNTMETTIAAANVELDVELEGKTVHLSIWDTAGQERYRSLTPLYFQGAKFVIFVFDLTKSSTLAELKNFHSMMSQKASNDVMTAVVGNKCDLVNEKQVTQEEIETFCKSINSTFYLETSAFTGNGIEELFAAVASKLGAEVNKQPKESVITLGVTESASQEPKKKGCC